MYNKYVYIYMYIYMTFLEHGWWAKTYMLVHDGTEHIYYCSSEVCVMKAQPLHISSILQETLV